MHTKIEKRIFQAQIVASVLVGQGSEGLGEKGMGETGVVEAEKETPGFGDKVETWGQLRL